MSKVTILSQVCKGVDDCGICAHVCPQDLFEACRKMNEAGYYPPEIVNEEECTGCLNCMISCPDYAIIVEKGEDAKSHPQEDKDATSQ